MSSYTEPRYMRNISFLRLSRKVTRILSPSSMMPFRVISFANDAVAACMAGATGTGASGMVSSWNGSLVRMPWYRSGRGGAPSSSQRVAPGMANAAAHAAMIPCLASCSAADCTALPTLPGLQGAVYFMEAIFMYSCIQAHMYMRCGASITQLITHETLNYCPVLRNSPAGTEADKGREAATASLCSEAATLEAAAAQTTAVRTSTGARPRMRGRSRRSEPASQQRV